MRHLILVLVLLAGLVVLAWMTAARTAGAPRLALQAASLAQSPQLAQPAERPEDLDPSTPHESRRRAVGKRLPSANQGDTEIQLGPASPEYRLRVVTVDSNRRGAKQHGPIAYELRPKALQRRAAPVFTGRTDQHGEQLIVLAGSAVPRTPSGEPRVLVGRVIEPGYQQRLVRLQLSQDGTGTLSLTLPAIRGATQAGRGNR